MNWKTIPLPPKMKALPKDGRGFPVPYIVASDPNGTPVFTVNDAMRVKACTLHRLCGICGLRLGKDQWLLGGCQSAFNPRGAYIDSPVHHECGTYALQVCPHLALSHYRGAIDLEKLKEKFVGTRLFVDPTQDPNRPAFFVFAHVPSWYRNDNGYVIPERPFLAVEYWIGGEQVMLATAHAAYQNNGHKWPDYFPQ